MSFNIILIILFFQIYSQIILQYKKEIKNLKNPNEIALNIAETEYYINIEIGTPPQLIKANVEFSKYIFYISGDKNYQVYNPNISSSYKLNSTNVEKISYNNFNSGLIVNETLHLNNNNEKINKMKIENFPFLLSGNLISNNSKMFSCGFGLGIPSFYRKNYINFIKNLYMKNIIDSYSFFFNKINENEGEIIIGLFPHEYYPKKYKFKKYEISYITITTYFHFWNCIFESIISDNITFYKEHMVLLDFNLEGLIIGKKYFDFVRKDFFQVLIEKKICFENFINDYNYFYCEKNKNIDFTKFKNVSLVSKEFNETFIFNYTDLFKEKGDYIFFMIFCNTYSFNRIVLGRIFFEKYQLGFNYDKKVILLYKDDLDKINKDKNYIFSIFLICILLIIFFIVLRFYFKHFKIKKKIYVTELEDNIKLSEKIL